MMQSVVRVDESGRGFIDGDVLMKSAVEVVLRDSTTNVETIVERLRNAHAALLDIAVLLYDREGRSGAPAHHAPASDGALPTTTAPAAKAASHDGADQTDRSDANVIPLNSRAPEPAPAVPTPISEKNTVARQPEPPVRSKKAGGKANIGKAAVAKGTKAKAAKPIGDILDLVQSVPSSVPQATPKRRATDRTAPETRLPKKISRIEDALRMDTIVCLEDGKAVADLGAHLASIGMTPDRYRKKWGLSPLYPMKAPSLIMRRGVTYEYDVARGKLIPTTL